MFSAFLLVLLVRQAFAGSKIDTLKEVATTIKDYPGKGWVPPMANSTQPLTVLFSFVIETFEGLDDRRQEMSTSGYLLLAWRDEFLQMPHLNGDSDEDQRVDLLTLSTDDIWTPTIAQPNNPRRGKSSNFDDSSRKVSANISSGVVTWYPGGLFQTRCPMDFHRFPFDKQVCSYVFTSWNNRDDSVKFRVEPSWIYYGNKNDFISHQSQLWQISKMSIREKSRDKFSTVTCKIEAVRISEYYFYTIIYPDIILLIALLAGLLHPHQVERPAYFAMILLSFCILAHLVGDIVPPSSKMPLFVVCLMLQMLTAVACTLESVVILRLFDRRKQEDDKKTSEDEEYVPLLLQSDNKIAKGAARLLKYLQANFHFDGSFESIARLVDICMFFFGLVLNVIVPIFLYGLY